MANQLLDQKTEGEAARQRSSTHTCFPPQTLRIHISQDVELRTGIGINPRYESTTEMHQKSVEIMKKDTADNRHCQPKQRSSNKWDRSAENNESSLPERVGRNDEEPEADWMNEEDAWFLLSTIFSGQLCRTTPFAEIAQDCPAVWRSALQAFAGDELAAREWLETRSPLFDGRRPLAVAMQVGGGRKVMQELKKLSNIVGSQRKRATYERKK